MLSEKKGTESDKLKSFTSLTLSPAVAGTIFLNFGLIHIALEVLSSSEKVKARDPRTLLNVYKNAPGHVPTQMLKYLEGFYESLWDNFSDSARNTVGHKVQTVIEELMNLSQIPEQRDFLKEVMDKLRNFPDGPSPNPSPIKYSQFDCTNQQAVGVI